MNPQIGTKERHDNNGIRNKHKHTKNLVSKHKIREKGKKFAVRRRVRGWRISPRL